jgi:3-oxoadipate CoA-transferase, beta subunit
MSAPKPLNREQMAWRVAQDIPSGAFVNLGIGMPEMVANHMPVDDRGGRDVIYHCENGILGMGPLPKPGEEDFDIVTAGKKPVTTVPGAAFFDSAESFAMIRGGHIDIAVLGAFQVAENGDLANWSTGSGAVPAVGGAMDLAAGAEQVFVIAEHVTKKDEAKLVRRCTFPLTGIRVVTRVFTDLAVVDVTKDGFLVREMIPGLSFDDLQAKTGATLALKNDWASLVAPAVG